MDLRSALAREFEAIRQHVTAMPSYMVTAQDDDDSLSDEALKTLCKQQPNRGSYFLFNTRGRTREQDSNSETSPGFWTNLLGPIQSFAEPGEEIHLH